MKEDYFAQACFDHPKVDDDRFASWTAGLPSRKETTPMHCGPHSIRAMELIYDICKPRVLCEIGFCLGHSASIWLNLGVERIVSIDNSNREETVTASAIMSQRYGKRFTFIPRDAVTRELRLPDFDAIFIDGGHLEKDVLEDTELAQSRNIRWMIFDDIQPVWGPGVLPAIEKKKLIPIALCGNMGLCVNRSHFE